MSAAPSKHVIVTGAASGIGLACVTSLLAEGHRVCGMDLQPFPIDQIKPDQRSWFIEARANVTSQGECVAATKRTVEAFGKINGLNSYGGDPFIADLARDYRGAHGPYPFGQRDRRVPNLSGRCRTNGTGRRYRLDHFVVDHSRRHGRRRPGWARLCGLQGSHHRPDTRARAFACSPRHTSERRRSWFNGNSHDRGI